MQQNFNPCENCPLKGKDQNTSLLLVGKGMGEIYTEEDYERMHGSLNRTDRQVAEAMESDIYPQVDGENCDGPRKALFVGKLGCRGYVA